MTAEQQVQLKAYLASVSAMSLEQLFEAFHAARASKAQAGDDSVTYWRAVLIGLGEQLHRRLGPGALQEYARRYC